MTRERLHKYLARSGVASRRAAETLIATGHVCVNGEVAATLGTTVDPDSDRVEVDGRRVRPIARHTYLALNKPVGVISTAHDPQGRPTVVDLVEPAARVYPVGRLDVDSEGLVLLTDDGDLAMRLTHPRHSVEKEYRALVAGPVPRDVLDQLSDGVELDDGRLTAPSRWSPIRRAPDGYWLRVVLREGRNRQVRRMAALFGIQILRLVRIRIGSLTLGELPPGHWRALRPAEVASLRKETA